MDALQIRAEAAHSLVGRGLIDGETALAYIVWPSEALVAASEAVAAEGAVRGRHSERTRLRALELVDAGCSWGQAARLVNVPKQTLATWIRKRRRDLSGEATIPRPHRDHTSTAFSGDYGTHGTSDFA